MGGTQVALAMAALTPALIPRSLAGAKCDAFCAAEKAKCFQICFTPLCYCQLCCWNSTRVETENIFMTIGASPTLFPLSVLALLLIVISYLSVVCGGDGCCTRGFSKLVDIIDLDQPHKPYEAAVSGWSSRFGSASTGSQTTNDRQRRRRRGRHNEMDGKCTGGSAAVLEEEWESFKRYRRKQKQRVERQSRRREKEERRRTRRERKRERRKRKERINNKKRREAVSSVASLASMIGGFGVQDTGVPVVEYGARPRADSDGLAGRSGRSAAAAQSLAARRIRVPGAGNGNMEGGGGGGGGSSAAGRGAGGGSASEATFGQSAAAANAAAAAAACNPVMRRDADNVDDDYEDEIENNDPQNDTTRLIAAAEAARVRKESRAFPSYISGSEGGFYSSDGFGGNSSEDENAGGSPNPNPMPGPVPQTPRGEGPSPGRERDWSTSSWGSWGSGFMSSTPRASAEERSMQGTPSRGERAEVEAEAVLAAAAAAAKATTTSATTAAAEASAEVETETATTEEDGADAIASAGLVGRGKDGTQ